MKANQRTKKALVCGILAVAAASAVTVANGFTITNGKSAQVAQPQTAVVPTPVAPVVQVQQPQVVQQPAVVYTTTATAPYGGAHPQGLIHAQSQPVVQPVQVQPVISVQPVVAVQPVITAPQADANLGPAAQQNRPQQAASKPSKNVGGVQCAPEALAVGIKHFKYDEPAQSDLVWSGYGSTSDPKYKIHKDVKPALQELVNAAKRDGVTLSPGSIYRGIARQREIVNRKRNAGQSARQIYFTSSHPGYSEHHTGFAVDFTPINNGFAKTAGYRWLKANGHKYGWEQTFTAEYAAYSGVSEESWHWRYVGKNNEHAYIFAASKARAC